MSPASTNTENVNQAVHQISLVTQAVPTVVCGMRKTVRKYREPSTHHPPNHKPHSQPTNQLSEDQPEKPASQPNTPPHTHNQPTNHSPTHSTNQAVDWLQLQPTNQQTNQPTNHPPNQLKTNNIQDGWTHPGIQLRREALAHLCRQRRGHSLCRWEACCPTPHCRCRHHTNRATGDSNAQNRMHAGGCQWAWHEAPRRDDMRQEGSRSQLQNLQIRLCW